MTDPRSGLVDRHIGFLEALRGAGLPVSLAEGLDAVAALTALPWQERETVRTAYAATVVKRQTQRATFDTLFDLYFPALVGEGVERAHAEPDAGPGTVHDDGTALARTRDELVRALVAGDEQALRSLAVDAVARFGAMPGRGPGLSSWSAYNTLRRVSVEELTGQLVEGLLARGRSEEEADRAADRGTGRFTRLVEDEARRRIAEEKGPDHVAGVGVRPTVDRIDFTAARRAELEAMRREVYPLARRLAARLTREQHSGRRRGALDFRRTVRASLSTGGVPVHPYQRPTRPHRSDLVVLCDVSGSVAGFAQFTLLLVLALRERFSSLRAFTFVDEVHEVTDRLRPGADPGEVLADLVASTAHAARWGRTDYGRAFTRFRERHADALGPSSTLLVLGDARSNHGDLAEPVLRELVGSARRAWWLNPEHPRHWGAGDSAAHRYAELVPMVECRNLTQLADLVRTIA